MIIDVHCHYTLTRAAAAANRFAFEQAPQVAAGKDHEAGPGALHPDQFDSCVAPRTERRLAWLALRRLLKLPLRLSASPELDELLCAAFERHLPGDGSIGRYVLLAFDAYHDNRGYRPPLPHSGAAFGSDIYTSNSLVHDLCRRHSNRFLFGASIHPYRCDALAALDEVAAVGACLVKWLPLHQNIDVRDARSVAFLQRLAELKIPLLAHYGEEFTLQTQHPEFVSVRPLLDVLRRLRRTGAMPTVIVAHVSTPVWRFGDTDSLDALCEALLGEFADAPLYADISALTAYGKIPFLKRIAQMQELHPKLLFGSDFPVPPALPLLRRAARSARALPGWPAQMLAIYRHLGFNDIVFHRAAEVLRLPR